MPERNFYPSNKPAEKPDWNNRREQRRQDVDVIMSSAKSRCRLQEQDFIDDKNPEYSVEMIERDQEMTRRMEEKFHEGDDNLSDEALKKIHEGKKRSEALETVIIDGGQAMEWFGPNARLIMTTRYDDIYNGVDGVLEFIVEGETPQRIALAIDASMRPDFSSVERKITRGISKVNDGNMKVKYFQSQADGFKGKLTTVIPIVLGLEGDNSDKLIGLFADIQRAAEKSDPSEVTEKIAQAKDHPAQVIFLREMLIQLKMYARLFKREGSFLKDSLQKITVIVENILTQKESSAPNKLESDGVYQAICGVAKKQTSIPKKPLHHN
jgi:hypothetical protein